MKHGTIAGCLAAAMLAGFSLAAHADNPYQVIIDRNPFALKPIPPPPEPGPAAVPTNAPPPSEIKLTGITTLLGPPQVFLQLVNAQTKKPEYPPPMQVGDKQMDVEVLSIDPEAGTVRIKQGDAETTLDFEKNGIKSAVAGGPAVPPVPGVAPLAVPPPPGAIGTPTQNGSRAIVAGNSGVATTGAPGNPGLPTRPVRTDFNNTFNNAIVSGNQPATPTPQPRAAMPTLSREDVEARIEAQRQILREREQSGGAPPGMSRILPPTRFSPPPAPGGVPQPQ